MKYLIVLLLFAGCHAPKPKDLNGRSIRTYKEECVNGVVYYYFGSHSSMSAKFLPNGNIETCK